MKVNGVNGCFAGSGIVGGHRGVGAGAAVGRRRSLVKRLHRRRRRRRRRGDEPGRRRRRSEVVVRRQGVVRAGRKGDGRAGLRALLEAAHHVRGEVGTRDCKVD